MADFTLDDLIHCYRTGIFPMSDARDDAYLFLVDPPMRGILPLDGFHIPSRLARTVRKDDYTVRIDTAFTQIIELCAEEAYNRTSTWISHSIQDLYQALFARGLAHSIEVWREDELGAFSVLARQSLHPASKALSDYLAPADLICDKIIEIAGQGIEASCAGRTIRLGRLDFVQQLSNQVEISQDQLPAKFSDASVCACGDDAGLIAVFALNDMLRPDALLMAQQLKAMGKQLHILSGDNERVVEQIAAQLQLDHAIGNLSPEEKYLAIQAMQKNGAKVAMVGDGMNDGPGLSIADVSIAMGQGAPITQARSDVLLLSNRLPDLAFAIRMCRKSLTLIKQNLAWAVGYNLLAIPAAMCGVIEPWHAAIGMSASSLIVVANSLRLLIHPKT